MAGTGPHLEKQLGLFNAVTINMCNMVGSGLFVALPLMLGAMHGPQALIGWIVGAAIAIADGLVWSELASALPGSGGTYVYLREAFGRERWGRFAAFLFTFQMISSGPLEIASGTIAVAQYLSYLWPGIAPVGGKAPIAGKLIAAGLAALAIILLYRKITSIARLMMWLWIGVLLAVGWIIVSGMANFRPGLAFSFPPGAFSFSLGFIAGLGSATGLAMYCYLGYYGVCYLGDEVVNPPRTIPPAVIISVLAVLAIDFLFCLAILGVLPWQQAQGSPYIACDFMGELYGRWAGVVICLLMVWTSFAGVYALMLTYSRIPYAAALDGNFFRVFGRLHPTKDFPHFSLLLVGGVSVAASFFDLAEVIAALLTVRIVVQFLGQVVALHSLRRYRPEVHRPFRMALYPVPAIVAFLGWLYVFVNAGTKAIAFGAITLFAGCAIFLAVSWKAGAWPFPRPALE
ncbi:MAG: APC family permease [Blastocatellia bacterium]